MDSYKDKLLEMKKRREEKKTQVGQETSSTISVIKSEIKPENKQFGIQKAPHIHMAAVDVYTMEVQCDLDTKQPDNKDAENQELEDQIELAPPRDRKKKDEKEKDKEQNKENIKLKPASELSIEEVESVVKSKHFNEFMNRSSKFVEKVMDHGDADMIEMLLSESIKAKEASSNSILEQSVCLSDINYTTDRVVVDFDWSPQLSELFLAAYSEKKKNNTIKDNVGVILLWNPLLKSRPEFYCVGPSAVTSAKFFPYSNSTVIGGCFNGQLLLWDIRAKSTPSERSGISAEAHKYPVNSVHVKGTHISNNIISFSNDGMVCIWDSKHLSKPVSNPIKIMAPKLQKLVKTTAPVAAPPRTQLPVRTAETASTNEKKEEEYISVSCCQFPLNDPTNYYVGSMSGAMYQNALHNQTPEKVSTYFHHNSPISAVSVNNTTEFKSLSGLVLTSSFDWTVKLWNPESKIPIRTFENSDDYIYDVCWNPSNPSLFATANNDGSVDLYDLSRSIEMPILHQKVSPGNFAINRLKWNLDGSILIAGDTVGNSSVLVLAEKYRRLEQTRGDTLEKALQQTEDEDM